MKRALVALLAMLVVVPVMAQENPEEPQGPPPGVRAAHNQVVRFLELNEEQIEAWNEIYIIHREAEQPLQEDIKAVQDELDALFETEDPDPAEVGLLVLERRALGELLFEVHLIYHEDFVALLDEEQQQRLGLVYRADQIQPVIPAFKLFELIPKR